MKKTLTFFFMALVFSITACKREAEVKPQTGEALETSNQKQSLSATAVVPLLVAGQKNSPGFVNGTGAAARFNSPEHIFVDGDGSLYVCDYQNLAIRKISIQNKVTTLNIDPELFDGIEVNGGPQSVAVLNNGTVGVQSQGYIFLYRNGAVVKVLNHFNDFRYGNFGGIDESPDGTYFNFITNYVDVPNEIYNSKLGAIKSDAYYGQLKNISGTKDAYGLATRSNIAQYVVVSGRLYRLTSTGATEAFTNLSLGATVGSIAVNKAGTEVYVTLNYGDIKRIKNNQLENIISGVNAVGIALANSEKYLYYTSTDHTVNRIPLP